MALTGRHLVVAAQDWLPWAGLTPQPDGSFGTVGLSFTFFDIIAEKMNFTYTVVKPLDGEYGRQLPNGSFTGIVGLCQRKEVDMGLGPLGVTYERSTVVDFSIPIFEDHFGILLPRPRIESDLAAIIKPLAGQVWLYLTVSIGISVLIGIFLNYILHLTTKDNLNAGEIIGIDIRPSWILMALTQEPVKTIPFSTTAKIYLITWLVAGLILSTAYSGVLTSILAVPRVPIPVDSLQDLASQNTIPWANEKGSSLHNLFSLATSGLYKEISDASSLVVGCHIDRKRVKEERMAFFCDVIAMKNIMSEDYGETAGCNYYIAQEMIKKISLSFGFPKGSKLTELFDQWLGPLKESGIVSHTVRDTTANATACLVKPGREGVSAPLTSSLMDLAGLFILLLAGYTCSTLVFVLELLVAWYYGLGEEEPIY